VVTRATARILQDVHLEGRMGRFVVEADEPLARGGTERGPSSLDSGGGDFGGGGDGG
jgi:uncharacterized membrane protein YgcG